MHCRILSSILGLCLLNAMPADSFVFYNWGETDAGLYRVEIRDATKHSTMQRTFLTTKIIWREM